MTVEARVQLIKKIEERRNSKVICYLTSVRPNLSVNMAPDAVRVFFEHLLKLPQEKVTQIDIFLCSNGGDGTVPWRLISLLREYGDRICVLLPYRAYSAASLLALGADEIVMHRFAEMGPIDPTVMNEFNPTESATNRKLGISVEDVKAYISFIKSTVGITHEDELVKTVEILANKVHPLALGNVERFISQSRLIAKKILMTHAEPYEPHAIDEIIETMASKLFFHGHPINRVEARKELKLKVLENPPAELETMMWDLYRLYEQEFENNVNFDPVAALFGSANPPQVAQGQIPLPVPFGHSYTATLKLACVESAVLSTWCQLRRRWTFVNMNPLSGDPFIREETLAAAKWDHQQIP